jgi:hypothetical protein
MSQSRQVRRFIDLFKALPPSAQWITVRPNGHGIDGHPGIVIQII